MNELKMYNPELLDKPRILGLSKSDIIDDELKTMISSELPEGLPHIYFSSVTGQGVQDLKDKIWQHVSKNEDKSSEVP